MYKEVARRLRGMIEEQDLWGKLLSPERDLASAFGVSRDTVRKGLEELEREGLITRRQGLGTLVRPPGGPASGLAAGNLLVGCAAAGGAEFISGIAEVAGRQQWLSSFSSLVTPGGRKEFAAALAGGGIDGVALLSVSDRRTLEEVREIWHGPLVLVDHHFGDLPVTSVMEDCVGGVAAAVEHLLSLGHRRVGYISHSRRELNPWKLQGYFRALEGAGIAGDEALVVGAAPTFEAGQTAAEQLLALPRPPTAIVTCSDRQAWGAWRAAELAGRTVGRDIALVGYGDTSAVAGMGHELSSVAFDPVEMGREAMRRVARLARGEERPGQLVLIPTELRVRESSKDARPPAVS
ncbi:MAG: substrate-binding domain-containing protein [Planctomycetota bacterium]|jgi:LacI family transcriptional regulator